MDWLETILFFLFATLKFAVAVPFFILQEKLDFWEALLFGVSSGIFGIFLFMYLSSKFIIALAWMRNKLGLKPKKKKRVFTKKNRIIVKIKSKYGLAGIAFLSPIAISLPVGCFLGVHFYKNKRKVFIYMLGGVILWSLFFSATTLIRK